MRTRYERNLWQHRIAECESRAQTNINQRSSNCMVEKTCYMLFFFVWWPNIQPVVFLSFYIRLQIVNGLPSTETDENNRTYTLSNYERSTPTDFHSWSTTSHVSLSCVNAIVYVVFEARITFIYPRYSYYSFCMLCVVHYLCKCLMLGIGYIIDLKWTHWSLKKLHTIHLFYVYSNCW